MTLTVLMGGRTVNGREVTTEGTCDPAPVRYRGKPEPGIVTETVMVLMFNPGKGSQQRMTPAQKRIEKNYLLICTTFAGGNPLKYVDEAWEYAPIFSE
jgi:hypothetical protein